MPLFDLPLVRGLAAFVLTALVGIAVNVLVFDGEAVASSFGGALVVGILTYGYARGQDAPEN